MNSHPNIQISVIWGIIPNLGSFTLHDSVSFFQTSIIIIVSGYSLFFQTSSAEYWNLIAAMPYLSVPVLFQGSGAIYGEVLEFMELFVIFYVCIQYRVNLPYISDIL